MSEPNVLLTLSEYKRMLIAIDGISYDKMYHYKRTLTMDDDLNNIVEDGIYVYATASIPANCPFTNAGVVEVFGGPNSNTQKIQRVTRYGKAGFSSYRCLSGGKWYEWSAYMTDINTPQIHYGTGEPSADLGKDGDLYFQYEEE